jgi:hypothetical protein
MASMEIERPEVDSRRQWQAYIDERLRDIGERAPEPILGQTPEQYCRAVCRSLKHAYLPEGHQLRQVKYDKNLPNDVLVRLVPQLLDAVKATVNDPANVPFGEFREIKTVDPRTGYTKTRFIGRDNFVKFMGRPGRRVLSFTTDRGRFDASGRPLR